MFWSTCIVVVLVVAVVIATPWILRAAVPEAFARFGLQASIEGGSLNPLRGEITLRGFTLGEPATPALALRELGVGVALPALLRGRLKLRRLRVRDVSVDAERLLELRKLLGTRPSDQRGALPVELDTLDLEAVHLVSVGERIGHDVRIVRLQLDDLSGLAAEKPAKVSLQATVGDGELDLEAEVSLDGDGLEAAGRYRIDKVPLPGWARLGPARADPLSSGIATGRGDVSTHVDFETGALELTLNGRLKLAALAAGIDGLEAEGGDAGWEGRLALEWSPQMASPSVRGDGRLDVAALALTVAPSPRTAVDTSVDDVSWQGNFEWGAHRTMQGAVSGTRVVFADGSAKRPAWRGNAEDFSWRMHAQARGEDQPFGMTVQDFALANLKVFAGDNDVPIEIAVEKIAVDELRSVASGNLVIGRVSTDLVTVHTPAGAGKNDGASIDVHALTATGLSGDTAGTLQAAGVGAASVDYAQTGRRVRAETVEFASVGLNASSWMGAEELSIGSARVEEGSHEIWISGVKAMRAHGDADGRFGAARVVVTHMFQSALAGLSWEATGLTLSDIDGDVEDAADISAIALAGLKLGVGDASWEGSGLSTETLKVTMTGDLQAARLGLDKLARRQPGSGDLRVAALDGRNLRFRDSRGVLDRVTATSAEYRLPDGVELVTQDLQAHSVSGDESSGLEVAQFSVARGAGRAVDGARLTASALETRGLTVSSAGSVAIEKAQLASLSSTAPDSATVGLDRLNVASLRWSPEAGLSTVSAAINTTRIVSADGITWALTELATSGLDWDTGSRIRVDGVTLGSASQNHSGKQDWLGHSFQAADVRVDLPADVAVASMSVETINGGLGSPGWKLASVALDGFHSRDRAGQTVDRLTTGALEVTDARNGAQLNLARAQVEGLAVSVLQELAARELIAADLRLASSKPDWPSRVRVPELRVTKPRLHLGAMVELEEVVARNPYLILAQAADNAWMWPPIPGGDAGGDSDGGANAGVRVARFSTRGPARLVYIDRATKPVFQLALDPLVVVMQNLDTRLPGSRAHFRARGTGLRLAGLALDGALTRTVNGFDLSLEVGVTGAYLPELNPYIARHEPFAVTTGWGDAHAKVAIEDTRLSGQVDVLMSGLEVKIAGIGSALGAINPVDFPLSTALALLKDRAGNIRLSIPLKAKTQDPSYDFVDSFQKDFVRSIQTAGRVAADLPGKTLDKALGLIGRTVSVLPGINTERYPPIPFVPGADGLTAGSFVMLNQLGGRLVAYPSLVLALCGYSVPGDSDAAARNGSAINRLFATAREGVYRGYDQGRAGLLALAAARADIVKRYLRDIHGVPGPQLAACDARVDATPDAKPRVEPRIESPAKRRGLLDFFF